MTVYSMTGYADAQESAKLPDTDELSAHRNKPRLGIEIRSVNSRFLDINFRLPEDLRTAEPKLRELLTKRIRRGKVDVRFYLDYSTDAWLNAPPIAWLQRLNHVQNTVLEWITKAEPLSIADVLKMYGSNGVSPSITNENLLLLTELALDSFLESRANEGDRLCSVLVEKLKEIKLLAEKIGPLIPDLVNLQKTRFLEKWRDAVSSTSTAQHSQTIEERALVEATTYALRIDVTEEISRLQSHLTEVERHIKKGGEIGKRLDFLIQEMHRETNTLGAKSGSLEMTKLAIEMKLLIEQMREQVQNLE